MALYEPEELQNPHFQNVCEIGECKELLESDKYHLQMTSLQENASTSATKIVALKITSPFSESVSSIYNTQMQ